MGAKMANELKTSLYKGDEQKVLSTDEFARFAGSELEDLVPHQRFVDAVDRIFRASDQQFAEVAANSKPIVPQVEAWAKQEKIELAQGWKVEVAKRVKTTLLSKGISDVDDGLVQQWVSLFGRFEPTTH